MRGLPWCGWLALTVAWALLVAVGEGLYLAANGSDRACYSYAWERARDEQDSRPAGQGRPWSAAEADAYRQQYTRLFWQEAREDSRIPLLTAAALLLAGYLALLARRPRRPGHVGRAAPPARAAWPRRWGKTREPPCARWRSTSTSRASRRRLLRRTPSPRRRASGSTGSGKHSPDREPRPGRRGPMTGTKGLSTNNLATLSVLFLGKILVTSVRTERLFLDGP